MLLGKAMRGLRHGLANEEQGIQEEKIANVVPDMIKKKAPENNWGQSPPYLHWLIL
ncbi:hypothetical protein ES705_10687 [subsurface metagenome]